MNTKKILLSIFNRINYHLFYKYHIKGQYYITNTFNDIINNNIIINIAYIINPVLVFISKGVTLSIRSGNTVKTKEIKPIIIMIILSVLGINK